MNLSITHQHYFGEQSHDLFLFGSIFFSFSRHCSGSRNITEFFKCKICEEMFLVFYECLTCPPPQLSWWNRDDIWLVLRLKYCLPNFSVVMFLRFHLFWKDWTYLMGNVITSCDNSLIQPQSQDVWILPDAFMDQFAFLNYRYSQIRQILIIQ